jgi:hypothetical protein
MHLPKLSKLLNLDLASAPLILQPLEFSAIGKPGL